MAELYNDHKEESHVGSVTIGVHLHTWLAKAWKEVYDKYLGPEYLADQSKEKVWEKN